MLIALTNASRAHEIKNLNPSHAEDFGDRITLHISQLTKSKRQSKPNISIDLITYHKDQSLDAVSCYRAYLKRTKEWRVTEDQKSQLFLSLVIPHAPVATSTISRWLREIMTEAGINTGFFKAHSVRGASTSKACNAGLSVGQIIDKANWSRADSFRKFYHKPINVSATEYQDKVFEL